jgi:MSHA biogenesis protein MshG
MKWFSKKQEKKTPQIDPNAINLNRQSSGNVSYSSELNPLLQGTIQGSAYAPYKKNSPKKKKGHAFKRAKMTKVKQTLLDNMALLIGSGMGVNSALRTLYTNTKSASLKKDLYEVITDVENGEPLWKAFEDNKFLPGYLVSLIQIGEESGNLPDKIKKTVTTMEKENKRASQLRSALFYPVFVLTLTITIGLAVSIFVLPRIGQVFSNLSQELPLITRYIIGIGNFMANWWYFVVPGLAFGSFLLVYILFILPSTKWTGQWIMLHFPVIRKLIIFNETARFSYNLSMLIYSGVPISRALETMIQVQNFYQYRNFIIGLTDDIKLGKSFRKSFEERARVANTLIPYVAQEIITAGEESGKLPEVLEGIGEKFEYEAEKMANNMSVLLEPILLLIIWSGVLLLALGILLPIYSLVGNFNF